MARPFEEVIMIDVSSLANPVNDEVKTASTNQSCASVVMCT